MSALSHHHTIEILTRHDFTAERLSRFDMVIFPGGRGDASDFNNLLKTRKPILQSYLAQGGTYLGICMGAYWADGAYFDLVDETRCVQYITRPKAEIRRSFPTTLRADWKGKPEKFYFFDGCAFIGSDPRQKIYATYANGDPMAVIIDNVGLIGCHLESELEWYPSNAMKASWHGLSHHRLLAEFVDDLLSKGHNRPIRTHEPEADFKAIKQELPETDVALPQEDPALLKDALEEIERETAMFTQGTFKKINEIARRALKATIPHQ